MANIIKIKSGASKPAQNVLQENELGYAKEEKALYIGAADGTPIEVGGGKNRKISGDFTASGVNCDVLVIKNAKGYGPSFPDNPVEGQVFFKKI